MFVCGRDSDLTFQFINLTCARPGSGQRLSSCGVPVSRLDQPVPQSSAGRLVQSNQLRGYQALSFMVRCGRVLHASSTLPCSDGGPSRKYPQSSAAGVRDFDPFGAVTAERFVEHLGNAVNGQHGLTAFPARDTSAGAKRALFILECRSK